MAEAEGSREGLSRSSFDTQASRVQTTENEKKFSKYAVVVMDELVRNKEIAEEKVKLWNP